MSVEGGLDRLVRVRVRVRVRVVPWLEPVDQRLRHHRARRAVGVHAWEMYGDVGRYREM